MDSNGKFVEKNEIEKDEKKKEEKVKNEWWYFKIKRKYYLLR